MSEKSLLAGGHKTHHKAGVSAAHFCMPDSGADMTRIVLTRRKEHAAGPLTTEMLAFTLAGSQGYVQFSSARGEAIARIPPVVVSAVICIIFCHGVNDAHHAGIGCENSCAVFGAWNQIETSNEVLQCFSRDQHLTYRSTCHVGPGTQNPLRGHGVGFHH